MTNFWDDNYDLLGTGDASSLAAPPAKRFNPAEALAKFAELVESEDAAEKGAARKFTETMVKKYDKGSTTPFRDWLASYGPSDFLLDFCDYYPRVPNVWSVSDSDRTPTSDEFFAWVEQLYLDGERIRPECFVGYPRNQGEAA